MPIQYNAPHAGTPAPRTAEQLSHGTIRSKSRPPQSTMRSVFVVAILTAAVAACGIASDAREAGPPVFAKPQRVTISGYDDSAMEPFLSRDGRHLLFNNSNDPATNTDLHYAERIDDLHFRYLGKIDGANSLALDGVASLDRDGRLYFVSVRDYATTLSTLYRGRFLQGKATEVALVPGVSRREPGIVNFDAEISADGATLFFVDGLFRGGAIPKRADIVIAQRNGDDFVRRSDSTRLMREINTPALEYAPAISTDGKTLLFTRLSRGIGSEPAIYLSARADPNSAFGPPKRLYELDGFVEAPTFSPDDRAIYYHKREGDRFVLYRAQTNAGVHAAPGNAE